MLMPFLFSLDNLLKDAYITFQKYVDNFEREHKTGKFLVGGCTPLNFLYFHKQTSAFLDVFLRGTSPPTQN